MNEQTVAIGALGRVINLSDRRIQQLVKEGVLERHEKGRYPFLSNVKAYVVYLQARADGGVTVIDLKKMPGNGNWVRKQGLQKLN